MLNEIYIVFRRWEDYDSWGERFIGAFKTKEGASECIVAELNDLNSRFAKYPIPSDEWFESHNTWYTSGNDDAHEYSKYEIVKYELKA